MFEDLRYATRTLRRNPGFTAVAVVTLALGIGANTAVFSVVNAALLRPRPGISHPEQLVSFFRTQKSAMFDSMGYPDYSDFRDRSRSFSGVAAHCTAAFSVSNGTAERLGGDVVTENYFEVLGVKPALGRLLIPSDIQSAVLSYGLWQRKFGSDPGALGSRISLNGYPFTVVGIAQKEFSGTVTGEWFDVWVPLASRRQALPRITENIMEERSAGWLDVFGRLKPGVRFEQAEAEMKTIAGQLAQAYPLSNTGRSVNLLRGVNWYPEDRAEVSGLLKLLSAAVALVLLIACANVAGLFMVRATGRQREIAVRLAVGGTRVRIIRQLLTEGMVVSLLGGGLGLLLAMQVTSLVAFRKLDTGVDRNVLAFTVAASLLTGLLFALLPAMRSLRVDLTGSLKNGTAGAGNRRSRFRLVLVVGQVAISFVLLAGAGLLLRNLYRIVTANPGYETTHLAMTSVDLGTQRYSPARGQALYRDLLERLPAVPGVVSATLASSVPPTEWPGRVPIFYPGQDPPQDVLRERGFDVGLWVEINKVAPGYFRTLEIRLTRGRDFTDREREGATGVVILNQQLAEKLWPGKNPIGKRISYPSPYGPPRLPVEVIGTAADTRSHSLINDAPLLMYLPLLQNYDGRIKIVVRTASDPRSALASMENAVRTIDPDVATFGSETMSQHIAASLWQRRMAASWIGAFSFMALVLAAIGLYGVIAQSVAQRTREVGIRMALGAAPGSIARLVIKEGMALVLLGLAIGVPLALATARMLPGADARDAASFAAVAALLTVVMLFACWLPARRATRVDPVDALRCE